MPDAFPSVTVVVTQRDRVSLMRESLSSLIENTGCPYRLVYVAGALPRRERAWLDDMASTHGFECVSAERPLTPAEARNLGLAMAATKYVAFTENDVVFKAGWLESLISCAEQTGADVVAPLTCQGRPIHTIVHHVGALVGDAARSEDDFEEDFVLQGRPREAVAGELTRRRTQWAEMHGFLARRSLFDRIGGFDPDIVSKEYLDFSWAVARAQGQIWVEPAAVVTFLEPSESDPVRWRDLPYFLLRWSLAWQRMSHDALKSKWEMREEGFIAMRRRIADWRIVEHVIKPALRRTPVLGKRWSFVTLGARLVGWVAVAAAEVLAWRCNWARRAGGTSGRGAVPGAEAVRILRDWRV